METEKDRVLSLMKGKKIRGPLIPIKVIECDKLHNWVKTL